MATALINYYQQRHDDLVAQKQSTQTAFNNVSADLKMARDSHATLVANSTGLTATIAAKRTQMASPSNMPADIEALAVELRELLIQRRHNTAALLNAEQSIDDLVAQQEQLGAQLSALGKAVSAAAGALARAQHRGALHVEWVSSEVNDLNTALKNEAQALLDVDAGTGSVDPQDNTGLISNARNRIINDIPEVLRDRARARSAVVGSGLSQQRTLVAALREHQRTQAVAVSADAGLLARCWAEYEEAEAALKIHAVSLSGELNRAVNLLSGIVASAPLTTAESDRIGAVALAGDSDAITTDAALTVARAAVAAKQLDLQLAITAAQVNDIDADPMNNATVQDEQDQLTTLQTDLSNAEANHTPALAAELDTWEGAVPDAIWANLHNYDHAIAALNRIVSSDGATLAGAFTNAENTLVTTLGELDSHSRLTAQLDGDAVLAVATLGSLTGSAATRQLSAARGDF